MLASAAGLKVSVWQGEIMMVFATVAVWPSESLVLRVTVKNPPAEYVWVTGLPVAELPSPKLQL